MRLGTCGALEGSVRVAHHLPATEHILVVGPLPPSVNLVDIDVTHMIFYPGLLLLFLHTASDQKLMVRMAQE